MYATTKRKQMKAVVASVLTALFVVAVAIPASAEAKRGPLRWFLTAHEIEVYLELTEDQVEQTQVLLDERNAAIQPIAEEQALLRAELDALLDDAEPDLEAIGATVVSIDANAAAIDAIEDQFEVDFLALLDSDQLLKYEHGKELATLLRTFTPPEVE